MSPKVSVIIPCYNQASYLPKTIASLQSQTLADWECIVVDDGSTDNTAEVVANIALNEPRVRLLQKINEGSASARDKGLQEANGQYIQFLDADDTITPEKLATQVALMEQRGLDITYTAFCLEDNQGKRTQAKAVSLNLSRVLVRWGMGASVPIHAFLYSADFIRRHNLLFKSECRYREDWKWHIGCFMGRPKQTLLPDSYGAIYYQNETGKTGSYIRMQEGNFAFMASMVGILKGWNKFLWLFRISEELWIWLLRMLKYRSTEIAKTILLLPTAWIIGAILLMPIAFVGVLRYFITTYIAR